MNIETLPETGHGSAFSKPRFIRDIRRRILDGGRLGLHRPHLELLPSAF